jgi:PAS domain S-box-containing protein
MHVPSTPSPGAGEPLSAIAADYCRLFALSLDLLCIAGMDGYFKQVNPSWTRVLGWSEAELLSRPVADFMHPEDREQTLQARARLASGVPVRGLENRYLCKDGSYRWLSWQSVVEPATATVFAVARDITERRQLDHEQLVMSKLESTGILAGGIAHDFNNLLAGLLLTLDLVSLCGATTGEQEDYLRRARKTIQAGKSLTEQLLAFASGSESAHRAIDLKTMLQESMNLALMGCTVHGECVVAPDLWLVTADESQIGQVIRNLVLNAREAAPDGGTVRLQAENVILDYMPGLEFSPGDYVRIAVSDRGAGIAAGILPKVFDPYFSTKQRGAEKGMGLGLTICRTVIHKHGGLIAIDSRPDEGTTVTCHLPAVRPRDESPSGAVEDVSFS